MCGIVVNRHANLRRAEYDSLRAILHNAARDGPAAQDLDAHPDFRAHLLGRIAWVELLNPRRGGKLRRQFRQIAWERG